MLDRGSSEVRTASVQLSHRLAGNVVLGSANIDSESLEDATDCDWWPRAEKSRQRSCSYISMQGRANRQWPEELMTA